MKKTLAFTAALIMPLMLSAAASAQMAATGAQSPSSMAPASPAMNAPSSSMAATGSSSAALAPKDKLFAVKAAQGGMAEVQLAQLAQQKSQDETVKKFAQAMIDDHTPNNEKLMKIAASKGVAAPTELDPMSQKMMTKLQALNGKPFDTAYLKGQVRAHKVELKLMENESKNGKDADLKAFADETAPVVQKHITMAQTGTM